MKRLVLNRLIVIYKLMFYSWIEYWIGSYYQQVVSEPGFLPAITPACCQSAHSWHSACQSIARLLHQSASRIACSVCVTPPACVYSLLKFLKSPTLICNHAVSSCRSIHHSIVVRTVEICEFISVLMLLREGTLVWLRCLTNVNPNFLLTAAFFGIPSYA